MNGFPLPPPPSAASAPALPMPPAPGPSPAHAMLAAVTGVPTPPAGVAVLPALPTPPAAFPAGPAPVVAAYAVNPGDASAGPPVTAPPSLPQVPGAPAPEKAPRAKKEPTPGLDPVLLQSYVMDQLETNKAIRHLASCLAPPQTGPSENEQRLKGAFTALAAQIGHQDGGAALAAHFGIVLS